ncbi:hypothetical protein C8R43DRAFT_1020135 [Mycena crocata]|nr:hypothetical protein C8R43DRAFT_1020135 [Mycena crocata]
MSRWGGNFQAAQNLWREAFELLTQWRSQPADFCDPGDHTLASCLQKLQTYHPHSGWHPLISRKEAKLSDITELIEHFEELFHTQPLQIFMSYLQDVGALKSPPYRYQETKQILSPAKLPLSKQLMKQLCHTLHRVSHFLLCQPRPKANEDNRRNVIVQLIQYWNPAEQDGRIGFPGKLMQYMNECDSDICNNFRFAFPQGAWSAFAITILDGPRQWGITEADVSTPPLELTLNFLWKLLAHRPVSVDLANAEAILDAISRAQAAWMTQSVIAMVKLNMLQKICVTYWGTPFPDRMARFWHSILPPDTAIQDVNSKLNMDGDQFGEEGPDSWPEFIAHRQQDRALFLMLVYKHVYKQVFINRFLNE